MLSVSISFGKISMCSCSAKPDLDTGKEDVNARNPADHEPCVAKWITLADLNRYNTLYLVACSLSTGMVPSICLLLK